MRIFTLALALVCCLPTQQDANAKKNKFRAEIKTRGIINCFPKGLMRKKKKKPVTCETSAVLFDGKQVFFGSDKRITGKKRSAVFTMPYTKKGLQTNARRYQLPFKKGKKYEDFTISPDRKYGFAITGFDRIKKRKRSWDKYNRFFYWKIGSKDIRMFPSSRWDKTTRTIPLRRRISRVLRNNEFPYGVPYYKIEGLAAIPGNRLLFGIREWGAKYYAFQYSVKIVSMSYTVSPEGLKLNDDAKVIYDFSTRAVKKLRKRVALSSLEYNPADGYLYMLTSYETSSTAKGLGAYLWRIKLRHIHRNKAAKIAKQPDGEYLLFAHKAEGMTFLDPHTLLVIHDDDRVFGQKPVKDPRTEFYRERHQAAYTIVHIK